MKKTNHFICSVCKWYHLITMYHFSLLVLALLVKSHYNDVIMSAIGSQITSPTMVFLTIYSDTDQRKHQGQPRVTGLCAGNSPGTGEFHAQMASNAENVSIWWRHHAVVMNTFVQASIKHPPTQSQVHRNFSNFSTRKPITVVWKRPN